MSAAAPSPTALYGIIAEFAGPGQLLEAARRTHAAGYRRFDVYSPFPIHGMDPAMGLGRSILGKLVFCGGLTGLTLALTGMLYINMFDYPIIVGGKPHNALEPLLPITFEVTVLLSAFTTVFGMLALNGLPRLYHPVFKHEPFRRATSDGFFLTIEACDPRFSAEETSRFLTELGGTGVTLLEE